MLLKFCIIAFFDCTFHSKLRYFQTFGWHIRIISCFLYPFAQIIQLFKLFCYILCFDSFLGDLGGFLGPLLPLSPGIVQTRSKQANGEIWGSPKFPHSHYSATNTNRQQEISSLLASINSVLRGKLGLP